MAKVIEKIVSSQSYVCYGIRERAYLNPAAPLHDMRGINLIQPENGSMNILVAVFIQPFRVATVTTMEHSTTLATTVTGGLLQRTMQQMHGTGT